MTSSGKTWLMEGQKEQALILNKPGFSGHRHKWRVGQQLYCILWYITIMIQWKNVVVFYVPALRSPSVLLVKRFRETLVQRLLVKPLWKRFLVKHLIWYVLWNSYFMHYYFRKNVVSLAMKIRRKWRWPRNHIFVTSNIHFKLYHLLVSL